MAETSDLIQIKPEIDIGYTQECLHCGSPLSLTDFTITGWRNLVKGECASCGNSYLFDMPIFHGIYYPTFIDIRSSEFIDKYNVSWWSERLFRGYLTQNNDNINIKIITKEKNTSKKLLIVNCIDFIYGHSLPKLLSVGYHIKHHSDYKVVVIIQPPFVHLMPDGVSEVWVVDLPFKKAINYYTSIDKFIKLYIRDYDKVYLSTEMNREYDLRDFKLKSSEPAKLTKVCYVYREDRLWGLNRYFQYRNIKNLFNYVHKNYPDISLYIIGDLDKFKFKNVRDYRTERITTDIELEWLEILDNALSIGVHGSNMMVPSARSKFVIELVPKYRYGNAIQATLIDESLKGEELLYKHRFIFGNNRLTNINKAVKNLVLTVIRLDAIYDDMCLRYKHQSIPKLKESAEKIDRTDRTHWAKKMILRFVHRVRQQGAIWSR
jgi:hypothetical protein